MLFSVIYSCDIPEGVLVGDYRPPGKVWQLTEQGKSEYAYLEGSWIKGKHRKWCALLTRKQFDEFIDKIGLYASTTETMGSLGAPGLGYGFSPAISFDDDRDDAILNAYVTPIPEISRKKDECFTARDWERVRAAVLSVYGS